MGTTLRALSPTPLKLNLAASTARSSSSARALTWRRGSSGRLIDGRRARLTSVGAEDGDGCGDSSEACMAETASSKLSSSIGEAALLRPAGTASMSPERLDHVVERGRPGARGAVCEALAEVEVGGGIGAVGSSRRGRSSRESSSEMLRRMMRGREEGT